MTQFAVRSVAIGAIVVLVANLPISAVAGCPCQKGGSADGFSTNMTYSATPIAEPYSGSALGMPYSDPQLPNGVTVGSDVPATGVPGVGPGYSVPQRQPGSHPQGQSAVRIR